VRDGQEKENLKALDLPIQLSYLFFYPLTIASGGQKPFYKKVSGLPKIFY
jgi:hypothetical protein